MIRIVGNQRRICCDNCRRPVGLVASRVEDRMMDPRAGYVLGVGKRTGITICQGGRGGRGCEGVIEHPIACSDVCEDRLLETWPRTSAEDVHAGDWGDDFRDEDVQ